MSNNKTNLSSEMNTYIALFRGINVGGKNILSMKSLSELFWSMDCENVKTYIQSGNVAFQTRQDSKFELAKQLSNKVLDAHGFEPKVLLLGVSELTVAIANNPFPTEEGKLLHFFFLDTIPESPNLEQLDAVKILTEAYHLQGNIFYFHTPDGVSRSKLFAKVERCLGVPATARNWNTVNKLSSMINSLDCQK